MGRADFAWRAAPTACGSRQTSPACGGGCAIECEGAQFCNDMVKGPGDEQVLLVDPSGNLIELFQPANR
jgi:hypothetical protein